MSTIYQYENPTTYGQKVMNALERSYILCSCAEKIFIRRVGDHFLVIPKKGTIDKEDRRIYKIAGRVLFQILTLSTSSIFGRIQRKLNHVVNQWEFLRQVQVQSLLDYTNREKLTTFHYSVGSFRLEQIKREIILTLKNHPKISSVKLGSRYFRYNMTRQQTHITPKGMKLLNEFFRTNNTVTQLDWKFSCSKSFSLSGLFANRSITTLTLDVEHFQLENMQGLQEFVSNSPSLTSLSLEEFCVGNLYNPFFMSLCNNVRLRSLKLSGHARHQLYDLVHIASVIRENQNIEVFHLNFTNVSGTTGVVNALRENHTITDLSLKSMNLNENDIGELAEIIQENQTIVRLSLSVVPIPPAFTVAIEKISHISHLTLNCCNFLDGERLLPAVVNNSGIIKFLCTIRQDHGNFPAIDELPELLRFNTSLSSLNIERNRISAFTAVRLARALKFNHTIRELNLSGNEHLGEEGMERFCTQMRLNQTITSLNLSNIGVDDQGAVSVANYLRDSRTLTSFKFNYNKCGFSSANAFAEAVKVNRTLKTLELNHCWKHGIYYQFIADALKVNNSITDISLITYSNEGLVDLHLHYFTHKKEIDDQKLAFLMASHKHLGANSPAHTHFFAHEYFDRTTVHKIFDFIGNATYIRT